MPVLADFIHVGNIFHVDFIHLWVVCLLTNHHLNQEVFKWIIAGPEEGGQNKPSMTEGTCCLRLWPSHH